MKKTLLSIFALALLSEAQVGNLPTLGRWTVVASGGTAPQMASDLFYNVDVIWPNTILPDVLYGRADLTAGTIYLFSSQDMRDTAQASNAIAGVTGVTPSSPNRHITLAPMNGSGLTVTTNFFKRYALSGQYNWDVSRLNISRQAVSDSFNGLRAALADPENLATYGGRLEVALDATGIVDFNVHDYVLLVRLTENNAADVFAGSLAGGKDVKFTDGEGNRIPFYRESWNAAQRRADFWVRVPQVFGGEQVVARLHYSRAGAADSSCVTCVFPEYSEGEGYVGVFTMDGATGQPTVDVISGTGLPPGSTPPTDTAGVIGRAKFFSGDSGSAFVSGDAAHFGVLNTALGPYAVSAWVLPNDCNFANSSQAQRMTVAGRFNATNGQFAEWAIHGSSNNGFWRFSTAPSSRAGSTTSNLYNQDGACVVGQWTHLVGTYTHAAPAPSGSFPADTVGLGGAAIVRLYVNGELASETPFMGNVNQPGNAQTRLTIGRKFNITGTTFQGKHSMRGRIDHVVLGAGVYFLSDERIKLDYHTQVPGGTRVTVGGLEP